MMGRNGLSLKKILKIFSLVILLLTSSCSILPFGSVLFPEKKEQSTMPAGTLFYDDFSSITSGWDQSETELGSTYYKDGSYHIVINETNADYFSTLYRSYADIGLQVDAQWGAGPADNNFGLLCRYQDEKNFYAGMISSDGYYGIFKIQNGKYTVLGHENMLYSEAIHKTSEKNQIVLNCYQDFLFLYVNGNLLDVQKDDTFQSGDVGMIAGSFEKAGVHILFDDFYLIDVDQTIQQETQK